ncbi:cell wall-binding repeat-containing protein [Herbiconiux sp.]|uniref:cell wall-binding repeat-containing protein n=1 Tax=Herbiconiux sp. TaxID=1871186 RepID=UPI0025C2738A|nr:cell wall-binding repeat-containing protein [Herbiconiux sp.]
MSVAAGTPARGGDYLSGDNGTGGVASISSDGRFVAFATKSRSITETPNPSPVPQVYVRDVVAGFTVMVSKTASGKAGDGSSVRPSISGDGKLIAFISTSPDLVPGVTDRNPHVFLWSSDRGDISVLDVSSYPKSSLGNGAAVAAAISRDGSKVAFTSDSTNLTIDDSRGKVQVYVRDVAAATTQIVSEESPGSGSSSGASEPVISADGQRIGFISAANLTGTDVHSIRQVYLKDMATGTVTLASPAADSASGANRDVVGLSMSGAAEDLAFRSDATNLTTDPPKTGCAYIRNVKIDTTVRFHPEVGNCAIEDLRIALDGRHVAFSTAAQVIPAVRPGNVRVYVVDRGSGRASLASAPATALPARLDTDSANAVLSDDGHFVAFSSLMTNLTAELVDGKVGQLFLRNVQVESRIDRIGGSDRFAVSAAISTDAFAPAANEVYVASGAVFPDALSASAAAGLRDAPVLLTTRDAVPPAVDAELARLQPKTIVLLGGTDTISPAVEEHLKLLSTTRQVDRVSGVDRYEVSAAISKRNFPVAPAVAYVASGEVFPDALSGSAAAGHFRAPVLLVQKNAIPGAVGDELRRLAPAKIVVLGGANTVSDSVLSALGAIAPASRFGGADRFSVSAAVSEATFGANTPTVYVASGAVFPDALSGSAAAIKNGAPVLLITADGVPSVVGAELRRLNPSRIVVLGGPATISDPTFESLRGYLAK